MARGNCDGTERMRGGGRLGSNMECFDKLPRAMREALANADHNWSAASLYEAYRRRHPKVRTSKLALAYLKQTDTTKHLKDAALGLVCPRYVDEV